MKDFVVKERSCDVSFQSYGPYWHVYTSGKETPLIFNTREDFAFAMNVVAQAYACSEINIFAFEIMGNHFHFVLSADEIQIHQFWSLMRKKMMKAFPVIKDVKLSLKPIDNLQSLRNNIIYTNRNGYVADPAHTPFSYPWGTGRYYFNDFPVEHCLSDIYTSQRRLMFRGRDPHLPGQWKFIDGYICPLSFCSIESGMAMFRDAHHYFYLISKNIESNSELASELGGEEFLTDSELFKRLFQIIKSEYGVPQINALGTQQKIDLAIRLRREFHSSNGQIRRLLHLSQYEIDSLFPLTA